VQGRMTDGGVRHGGRSNGRWRRGIRREEKVPQVGLAWAEVGQELGRLQKIPGKMKRAAKIDWAENELGSTAEFRI
jgi:hypothetical protein